MQGNRGESGNCLLIVSAAAPPASIFLCDFFSSTTEPGTAGHASRFDRDAITSSNNAARAAGTCGCAFRLCMIIMKLESVR